MAHAGILVKMFHQCPLFDFFFFPFRGFAGVLVVCSGRTFFSVRVLFVLLLDVFFFNVFRYDWMVCL
jgi:hypothetical protein